MTQILLFVVLGLGAGALYAGLALGLVLTYRGSGTVNMAVGAIAAYTAYTFYGLHTGGYLWLIPLPGLPDHIQLGNPWPVLPALLLSLVLAGVVGALVQLVALYPLRNANPVARLLATLGALIVLNTATALHFGSNAVRAPAVFDATSSIELFGQQVSTARLYIAAVVIVFAIVAFLVYRFTRFGLNTRAASENEALAQVSGLSPRTLSMVNTVAASVVCGALGILCASQTQLDPTTIPLAVVPALGAALLARFTSFGIAVGAGLGLGVVQSLVTYVQAQAWFPTMDDQRIPGVADVVVFIVIVVAVLWRGDRLPPRGTILERSLPSAPEPERIVRPAVIGGIAVLVGLCVLPYDYRQALAVSLIGIILCLSLVVITGYVGLVSLLQVALAGAAGFAVCRFAGDLGIGFPLGPILAICVAVVLGVLTSAAALRVRGINLAILSISAAVTLRTFVFQNPVLGAGGSALTVEQPTVFGYNIGTDSPFRILSDGVPSPLFGALCAVCAFGAAIFVARLRGSQLGKRMLAVRSNERAAAAAGIAVRRTKFIGFAIASALAGLSGVLYTYNYGSVTSARFDIMTALTFLAFAYIAGITSVSGAVIAGLAVSAGLMGHFLDRAIGLSSQWQALLGGLGLVIMLARQPEGIAGQLRADRARWRARRHARHSAGRLKQLEGAS